MSKKNFKQITKELAEKAKSKGKNVTDKAKSKGKEVAGKTKDSVDEVKDRAKGIAEKYKSMSPEQKKNYKMIGTAVGVGAVGTIAAGKMSDKDKNNKTEKAASVYNKLIKNS